MSFTVSVATYNNGDNYTYPMVIERWKPTIWSLSSLSIGMRNATEGMLARRIHMHIYASSKSALLRKSGPSAGSTSRMKTRRQCIY